MNRREFVKTYVPRPVEWDKDADPILFFSDPYSFLDNFSHAPMHVPDWDHPDLFWDVNTSETAYQGFKTLDPVQRREIMHCSLPHQAKSQGRRVSLRDDWRDIRLHVMYSVLHLKFSYEDLRRELLSTGNCYLEEGNYHGDDFWGTVGGVGENHLGRMLMQIREEIRYDIFNQRLGEILG